MLPTASPSLQSHGHLASGAPAPAPRYWAGVDGGGTHTRLRLTDAAGHTLGEGQVGPSALGQGPEAAWAPITEALVQAARAAGWAQPPAWGDCGLGLGLSGAGVEALAQRFAAAAPRQARWVLCTDGHAALLGAHAGRAGALVIAGTGSVAEALGADGQRRSAGGWGWQQGDEGSGAWLGRAAVRHTQRALDGRDTAGTLAQAVRDELGHSPAALLHWSLNAGQAAFAALAPLVFAHEASDPVAAALLVAAVAELTVLAQAVDPSGALPVVWAGSIAARLAPRLGPALRARSVPAQGDAMAGALALARTTLTAAPCPTGTVSLN
jgi:glucosamine kinase